MTTIYAENQLSVGEKEPVITLGVVIIGRNEGERLRQAILSVGQQAQAIVYVDSGSADNSVTLAQQLHCHVVNLEMNKPFSAARGRNAGLQHLLAHYPTLQFVQFMDGDCTLDPFWLEKAVAFLQSHPDVVVLCGRRRERYPNKSVYNLLCDMEWDTPLGETTWCGGDSLMRVDALRAVGGFNEAFAAGEEPELCYRLRQRGGKIWRLDAEMTLHDANMTRFGQWWQRSVRSGSAYVQTALTYWRSKERPNLKESLSIWFWAGDLPLLSLIGIPITGGTSLLILLAYPYLASRIFRYRRQKHGDSRSKAARYAFFTVLGKFAQLQGQLRFLRHRRSSLIEYK